MTGCGVQHNVENNEEIIMAELRKKCLKMSGKIVTLNHREELLLLNISRNVQFQQKVQTIWLQKTIPTDTDSGR